MSDDKEKQPETPVEAEKNDVELSNAELDGVAGGAIVYIKNMIWPD